MKHALLALMMCTALSAQTKAPAAPAPKAAPKAATSKATPAKAKAAGLDLLKPDTIKGKPPEIFIVRLETTKGNIDIRVVRNWSPNGVERFYNLVRAGFYDNSYFFRVLDFMAQTGLSSDPAVSKVWANRTILDERVIQTNSRGTVTMAMSGEPNSRTTQIFINKIENSRLDPLHFVPLGEVVEGMNVVDLIYPGYGEQPDQGLIQSQGEAYLNRYFPRLDKIISATILQVVEQ